LISISEQLAYFVQQGNKSGGEDEEEPKHSLYKSGGEDSKTEKKKPSSSGEEKKKASSSGEEEDESSSVSWLLRGAKTEGETGGPSSVSWLLRLDKAEKEAKNVKPSTKLPIKKSSMKIELMSPSSSASYNKTTPSIWAQNQNQTPSTAPRTPGSTTSTSSSGSSATSMSTSLSASPTNKTETGTQTETGVAVVSGKLSPEHFFEKKNSCGKFSVREVTRREAYFEPFVRSFVTPYVTPRLRYRWPRSGCYIIKRIYKELDRENIARTLERDELRDFACISDTNFRVFTVSIRIYENLKVHANPLMKQPLRTQV
jgi:hypothetical protein